MEKKPNMALHCVIAGALLWLLVGTDQGLVYVDRYAERMQEFCEALSG